MEFRLKILTGPVNVNPIADRLEGLARVRVTCRGTEHVYANVIAPTIDDAKQLISDGSCLPWLGAAVVQWAVEV